MNASVVTLAALIACAALGSVATAQPEGFKQHAVFKGIGACLGTVVGPGPEPGSERLYASHVCTGTLDIVATDPLTGKTDVFPSPVAGECGAWAVAVGADGQVYIGTVPTAHIMRVDWQQKKLVDMGRPSETEQYIWQLCLGTDKKLYGCTYPGAKLVRFDPATGKGEDLGRMSETEQYARWLAADDQGFVYVGVGMSQKDLVAYEIATGEHKSILPADQAGQGCVGVVRGTDGVVYADTGKWLKLVGWTATPTPDNQPPNKTGLQLADGRGVSYDGHTVDGT